jgi:hypothetical protein
MADIQIRSYKEQYGLNYKSVIPCNIYGPNDNFHIENGHVLPALIHKCYLAKQNNTPLYIWGSGAPLREFIYSKDVAEITNWILENYDGNEPIISGTLLAGSRLYSTNGIWTGFAPTKYDYQWFSGSNMVSSANSSYLIASGDVGQQIKCKVIASSTRYTLAVDSDPVTIP